MPEKHDLADASDISSPSDSPEYSYNETKGGSPLNGSVHEYSGSIDDLDEERLQELLVNNGAGTNSKNRRNIFENKKIAEHFAELYEDAEYECRHLFKPDFEWETKEEKKLVRKLDWYVCFWACIMFAGLQIDRGNIGQALSDGILGDLGMDTNDYNYGQTIFLLSFMCAEIPSQLVSKKLGPDRWVPTQMVLWSIVACCQAAVQSRGPYLALRSLMGILEGGFIPDLVLWLSYFYTSKELPIRLGFFWAAYILTQILTSLLAFGLLRIKTDAIQEGWRWLFLIEGLITFCIGVASYFKMPASAAQTKTWFRKKGWFTEREELIVVNRVLRDDPYKGDMHNRAAITPKKLWTCLCDYHLWPIYAIGIMLYIPPTPVASYMTLNLRHLGFSTFNTNLLTIPYLALELCMLLLVTKMSEVLNERALVCLAQPLWILPCIAILRFWSGAQIDIWGTWAVTTVLLGYPYVNAIVVAWTSRNSNTVSTRTVASAMYNMCVQAGNVMATNIYRNDDKPLYKRGNTQLFAINIACIVLLILVKIYYVSVNNYRDKKWAAMTKEEQVAYLRTTKDRGNRRLDFRFAH
jgi:hypothetical protein